jgi:hypothetical protein
MSDARFEDGRETPLRLLAQDGADLAVISALVQDSVLTGADMTYRKRLRRFSLLLNRFRWEFPAQARGLAPERVRSVLDFADVRAVRHQGMDLRDSGTVLTLLSVQFTAEAPGEEGGPAGPGRVTLVFAGDGAIALDVECLDVQLRDVTRPYVAPSRRTPDHGTI